MQDKDEKTAQGGSMTRQQAEQEMEQLRKVFPSVRMLTAEQVQAGEAVGDAARQALEEKTTHSRMEYRGQELYEVTALFAQVEGTPCVLELERRLDRIMLLDPEESEQLFNNLAEYRGKLYRDAVTGAYNERYYQEKYRSRILTAGVAVLRVDDFKAANDVYGRYAGNSVLETVAGVLRRNLGEKDRLIRRGEDRLLLLLPEVGQSDFGQKLEHLRLQLAAAGVPGYSHLHISVSIGGVWIRDGEVSAAVEHAERLATYAQMQKNTVITEQQPERTAAAPVHRRQSVLIVDDSELNRKMLGQMLGSRFDIAEAASGEACLQLLEQNATGISIVLLDIHMPGIDGFTVLEEMNQKNLLEQIPVIMISSEDTVDAVRRASLSCIQIFGLLQHSCTIAAAIRRAIDHIHHSLVAHQLGHPPQNVAHLRAQQQHIKIAQFVLDLALLHSPDLVILALCFCSILHLCHYQAGGHSCIASQHDPHCSFPPLSSFTVSCNSFTNR